MSSDPSNFHLVNATCLAKMMHATSQILTNKITTSTKSYLHVIKQNINKNI